jgi:LPPG:FO 2-phospho-L-lactate transferase
VDSAAPVVGLSPIVGGAVVRGMADKLLPLIGVATSASGVALGYGAALLDGWLVDTVDVGEVPAVEAAGIECRAVPLLMRDLVATAAMARAAIDLAGQVAVG